MIYTYRKLILIILVILFIGGAGLTVFLQVHKNQAAVSKKDTAPTHSVATTGLSKTPVKLPDSVVSLIESSVDTVVTTRHGSGTYTATYRDGSYIRKVYPSGTILTTLLIDVKQTKETYLFTRTGSDDAQASTSYIYCAPDSQQMVYPSICKDPAEGY